MDIATIFTQMSWVSALLLIVGAVFVIIEFFVPGFGFWGIAGALSIVAGAVVRICQGLSLEQSLAFALMLLGCFVVVSFSFIISAKFGILGHTGLVERKSSLSPNYNVTAKELRKLVGRSGKAITNLDLAGKAKIRGKVYDVISINAYIEKNAHIKVVQIRDNEILVRKWFE